MRNLFMRLVVLFCFGLGLSSYAISEEVEIKIAQKVHKLYGSFELISITASMNAGSAEDEAEAMADEAAFCAAHNANLSMVHYLPNSSSWHKWSLIWQRVFKDVAAAQLKQEDSVKHVVMAAFNSTMALQEKIGTIIEESGIGSPDLNTVKQMINNLLDIDVERPDEVLPEIRKYYIESVGEILKLYHEVAPPEEMVMLNKKYLALLRASQGAPVPIVDAS